jgi:thioesterase domain-containing protein
MLRSDPVPARSRPLPHVVRNGELGYVVVVHPGALPASMYGRLAAALPQRVGVVVLDLQGVPAYVWAALSGGEVGDTSVVRIADDLIDALLGTEVARPGIGYVLVGWSFGGVVAHQMTHSPRLRPTPRHLVLLDSISAADGYAVSVEDLREELVLDWFEMYLRAKRPGAPGSRASRPSSLADVLARGVRAGTLRPGTSLDGLAKAYAVFVDGLRRNTRLANPHIPQRTSIPATVVRAEGSLLAEPGALGYDRLVPAGAPVLTVPGDHYGMLDNPAAMDIVAAVCLQHLAPAAGAASDRALLEILP